MATQYSVSAYPAAVTLRSKRTLLVEGPSDKSAFTKLIIALRKHTVLATDNVVIDTAQDLPDASGGNRERVEAMHASIGGSTKFAALVDREFRRFDLQTADDHAPYHVEIPTNLFWTRGHSTENYFSDAEYVIACLEQHYPEHLPDDYSKAIARAFPSILRSTASITLALEPNNPAAQPSDRLSRVSSIKQLDAWRVLADGSLEVNPPVFELVLVARGFTQADAVAFSRRRATFMSILEQKHLDVSRWICHGHLVDSYLWTALGTLLLHNKMEPKYANQIAWGNRQAQGRTTIDKWSDASVQGRAEYPRALLAWLCA